MRGLGIAAGVAMATCLGLPAHAASGEGGALQAASLPNDLTQLSLEDLLNIQVTSVSRVAESLSGAPAAIQVISAEDIRRTGARSLPEALQLVTGLQVARIDGRSWAITARGFNASTADKLEVRLDGRSLYTPLFSGVIWEAQAPDMEDIERIEIIRGPGASLWGANAVNGVINIVSKSAYDTLGTFVSTGGGNELEHHALLRHGMRWGRDGALRVYLQSQAVDATASPDATPVYDAREIVSAGLRGDLRLNPRDELMFNLNTQSAKMDVSATGPRETMAGVDLSARWQREFSDNSDLQLQFNSDYFDRDKPGTYGEIRKQADIDLRHRFHPLKAHELVWGASYRISRDQIRNTKVVFFDPAQSSLNYYSVFAQDRVDLSPSLTLTLGSKLEHNSYTGFEYQPSLRLAWLVNENNTLWAAASRAARVPNRVDRALGAPGPTPGSFLLVGNDTFESELAKVAELGWRSRLAKNLSVDLATYYADYDKLRGFNFNAQGQPFISNEGEGRSYGVELSSVWTARENLRLWASYSYLNLKYQATAGSPDFIIAGSNENDPRHQAMLRVAWDVSDALHMDSRLHYIGPLLDLGTPAYTELDLNFSVALRPGWALELSGRNLLHSQHPQFNDGTGASIERSVYAGLRWESQ